MRLLLDAPALIWSADDPSKFGSKPAVELRNPENDLLLSAGTVWEIAIKVGIGRLSLSMPYQTWMDRAMEDLGITLLGITVKHANAQVHLPTHRGDPFDRRLIAQATVENLDLVSNDGKFDRYGIQRLCR